MVPYAGEEVSALAFAELPSGHLLSVLVRGFFPVVPWLCPNDTDESARATLGMLSGLTALGQDKRVLEDSQVATLAEDGYVGKIINLPY